VSCCATLLLSPSWFLHYPALATGPLALSLAAGSARLIAIAASRHRNLAIAVAVVLTVPVLAQGYRQRELTLGRDFPGAELGRVVEPQPGCVAADDPASLIGMDVLSRNLRRRCPFIADFGGYSYMFAYEQGWARAFPRSRDPRWQQMYLGYLRTAAVALPWRYERSGALSATTEKTIDDWRRVEKIGRYVLRDPDG
jgi:hypothetical protein